MIASAAGARSTLQRASRVGVPVYGARQDAFAKDFAAKVNSTAGAATVGCHPSKAHATNTACVALTGRPGRPTYGQLDSRTRYRYYAF